MVRQVETEQREFFLKKIFRNFIGKRGKEQVPEKADNLKDLLREVCDEGFLKEVEKLSGKRKRMLFWLGEFSPPKRLMSQYRRYTSMKHDADFSHQRSQRKVGEYKENFFEAATRRPFSLIDHWMNRSEAKYYINKAEVGSSEAQRHKWKSEDYGDLIADIKKEMKLYEVEIERLKKLLETIEDVEEGLKIEQAIEELEEEISSTSRKSIYKKAKEGQKQREIPMPTTTELLELILKVQSKEEFENLYGSHIFQWIRHTRKVFKKEYELKDEFKNYENSLKSGEENLKKVRLRIQELKEKQANRPLNYQEYRQLRELTEKETRIAGGNVADRCICEIIKLEEKFK